MSKKSEDQPSGEPLGTLWTTPAPLPGKGPLRDLDTSGDARELARRIRDDPRRYRSDHSVFVIRPLSPETLMKPTCTHGCRRWNRGGAR